MKSLKPRLLTAVIGIPILLIVLFVSELWHPFVGIVIGVLSAFMTGEYLHARKMLYKFHLSIPCMLFTFLLSVLVTTKYLYVLIFAFILTVFAVMIFKHEKTNYADVAYSVFGTFFNFFWNECRTDCLRIICINYFLLYMYFRITVDGRRRRLFYRSIVRQAQTLPENQP